MKWREGEEKETRREKTGGSITVGNNSGRVKESFIKNVTARWGHVRQTMPEKHSRNKGAFSKPKVVKVNKSIK